jgi:hypothetical protein
VDVRRPELAHLPRQRRTPGPVSRSTPEHQPPPTSPPTRRSPQERSDQPLRRRQRAPIQDGALHGALCGALCGAPCGSSTSRKGTGTRRFCLRAPVWRDRHDMCPHGYRTRPDSPKFNKPPAPPFATRDRVMGNRQTPRGGEARRRCAGRDNDWGNGPFHSYGARSNGRVSLDERAYGRTRCPPRGRRPRSEGR